MPSSRGAMPKKATAKENAAIVKSLKADNARRQAAMDTAAKAGIKLEGSRYEDGSIPNLSRKQWAAVADYAGTKAGKKDAEKAAIAARNRNIQRKGVENMRPKSNGTPSSFTG